MERWKAILKTEKLQKKKKNQNQKKKKKNNQTNKKLKAVKGR
jgi:hypothetical protein